MSYQPRNISTLQKLEAVPLRSKRALFESPGENNALGISPSKRLNSGNNSPGTQKTFALDTLDSALNHYFSPKKKQVKSPSRAAKRLNFEIENDNFESDNDENTPPFPSAGDRNFKCDLDRMTRCFSQIDNFLPNEIQQLMPAYKKMYSLWTNYLLTGKFNLVFHGIGSKRDLLNDYVKKMLQEDHYYMTIEGFKPTVNCRQIFIALNSEFVLDVRPQQFSLLEWAKEIKSAIERKLARIFLIIHNIDGFGLRENVQQEALSILAESTSIHLICSIDHMNTSVLWDQKTFERFNWLFVPTPTFQTYGDVLITYGPICLGLNTKTGGRSHTFSSLEMFWGATTQNMQKIMAQLAIHAGSAGGTNDSPDELLTLTKFCKILKQEFATTSEAVLRQQLNEFVDSSVIRMNTEGCIELLVDRELLISFLETKDI